MGGLADLSMIGSIVRRIVDSYEEMYDSAFVPLGQKQKSTWEVL